MISCYWQHLFKSNFSQKYNIWPFFSPFNTALYSIHRDLEFALTLSIDWVALSFVQKPEDILELRALAGPNVKVRGTWTSRCPDSLRDLVYSLTHLSIMWRLYQSQHCFWFLFLFDFSFYSYSLWPNWRNLQPSTTWTRYPYYPCWNSSTRR